MVNVGYHTARIQGKMMRSLYQAVLPQIVKLPISQTQKIPISVYALSCERDLPEQVASLRSFIRYAGIYVMGFDARSVHWFEIISD